SSRWWFSFPILPAEREGHKADYGTYLEGPARGENSARIRRYVESWQGVRRLGEGRTIGLKSRFNPKIMSKSGLCWRVGFSLMEARYYRHSMGWQSASSHGKNL